MDLDWNDLKALQALAQGGSVAGAARLLSMDASTVSRRLTSLEEAVGARLVVRTGRELQWTAEGRLALDAAKRVSEQLSGLVRDIRAAKTGIAGEVKVSCTPATVLSLSSIVEEARERYPELRVELTGQLASADLGKGEADIALRAVKPTSPELVVRRGIDVGWYVVVSKAYADERGIPRSEAELRDHALVLYGGALRESPGPRWMEARCPDSPRALRLDSPDAVIHAIASGAGIGVVPYPSMHGRKDIVRVFETAVAWAHLWIVYHQSHRDAARIRAVVDLLVEHIESHAHLYTGGPKPEPPR